MLGKRVLDTGMLLGTDNEIGTGSGLFVSPDQAKSIQAAFQYVLGGTVYGSQLLKANGSIIPTALLG